MERLTLQDVLDKNYEWFVVKKMPPGYDAVVGMLGPCFYDGPPVDGKPRRCSIGCVLPESLLGIVKNSRDRVRSIVENDEIADFLPADINALTRLQSCHDGTASYSDFHHRFEMRLKEWAESYSLRWPGKAA